MKVYLCSQFARQTEMRQYRNDLLSIGWHVTSHWIDAEPGDDANYAIRDLEDLDEADALIYFPGPPYYGKSNQEIKPATISFTPYQLSSEDISAISRGGRHFEMGVAHNSGKTIIVIGEPESDFQKMPGMENFKSWSEFMSYVTI